MKRRNFLISPSALALGAAAGSIAPSLRWLPPPSLRRNRVSCRAKAKAHAS